eukprot:CAMPEP_0178970388 /NCGR_PEP_ID=MMETSP0789-20121207/19511_1 /TAXON_ID=3005 /ORGANISM="Rhizosolenia setigera, Strain CCMP 1694" /LENGTH=343 /DNA_ID=CAMNT_0020656881 /DNA_START=466 /DNA_END=1497 /DNA_ORIENTATION=-
MVNRSRARLILVGTGRMGAIRAKIMYANPKISFLGVCDLNIDAATKLANEYSTLAFGSLKDAVQFYDDQSSTDEKAIDGIVVCTPTFTHDIVIREAADYGIHVFTEKPVDETSEKIVSLYEYCNERETKLCCGFQRRFDASYKAVSDAVRGGKIGKPMSASIFFADHPCPPIEFLLSGGDIFMDLSAHDLDYIRYTLDDDVESVYATGSSSVEELKKAGIYDNATMVMTFKKGTVVTLTMSRSACYGYDQRCEIFGSEGLATVNNEFKESSIISNSAGVHQSRLKHSFPERFDAAFTQEIGTFVDCILDEKVEWPIGKDDCIATQLVADAARRSSQLQQVIKL